MRLYNNIEIPNNIVIEDLSISLYKPKKYLKNCEILFQQKMNASMKIWLILLDINGKICINGKINPIFLKAIYQTNQDFIAYYNKGKTYLILYRFIMKNYKTKFKFNEI